LKVLAAPLEKRNSRDIMMDREILSEIQSSGIMQDLWRSYQRNYNYAEDVIWDEVMNAVRKQVL
jgi:hypothetical protein